MAVALRAEITQEEYASIRVAALKAGVSTQEYVGSLLRRSLGVEAERGKPTRLDVPNVAAGEEEITGLAPPGLSPRSVSSSPDTRSAWQKRLDENTKETP